MKPILIIIGTFLAIIVKSQIASESELLQYISMNTGGIYDTQVLQMGDQNLAVVNAKQISVTQTGDFQQFYYNETSILPSDLNVNVEGQNSYVEIYGNNQIMNDITINIQGDNRNVIIRNYP